MATYFEQRSAIADGYDVVQLTEPHMPQLATGLCAATAWRIARAPRVATLQTIACVSRVWGPAGARPFHWLRGKLTATKLTSMFYPSTLRAGKR